MAKQEIVIRGKCFYTRCQHQATYGVYHWKPGQTDVDLNRPVAMVCGRHKPLWRSLNEWHRNVKLRVA